MDDYIIRATAAEGKIRAFAATTTNLVNEAQRVHGLYPVPSAALGRAMTGILMMAMDMKGKDHTLSLTMKGGGPLGNLVVMARADGRVKGYVDNPQIELPLNHKGKLDVGGAIGAQGKLTIIKDLGVKEPYAGQVNLVSGEVGEDLTYYMALSEQKPSAIGLGVLVNPNGHIRASGGFMIQPMPGASDELISELEERIAQLPPISSLVDGGKTPEEILNMVLGSLSLKVNDSIDPYFSCDCSGERLESVLLTIGTEELESILKEDKGAELVCHYCNKKYKFNEDDIRKLIGISKTEIL